jgi:hypothetical protein
LGTGPGAEVATEVGGNAVGVVVGAVVGAAVVGAAVVGAAVVGAAVVGAAVVGATVVGAVVAVGVVGASSAMTREGPNGVSARAMETTKAAETAGYATTARRRMRRAGLLLTWFTGSSLGLLVVGGKDFGWSGRPGHPKSDNT